MLIEFELRPLDMRAVEMWAQFKGLASFRVFRMFAFLAPVVGLGLWYRYPGLLPVSDDLSMIFMPLLLQWSVVGAFFAVRSATLWRVRRAASLVEGQHSAHFSVAGIHHVSPVGTQRFAWSALKKIVTALNDTIGMALRKLWGLWNGSQLRDHFRALGIRHLGGAMVAGEGGDRR